MPALFAKPMAPVASYVSSFGPPFVQKENPPDSHDWKLKGSRSIAAVIKNNKNAKGISKFHMNFVEFSINFFEFLSNAVVKVLKCINKLDLTVLQSEVCLQ